MQTPLSKVPQKYGRVFSFSMLLVSRVSLGSLAALPILAGCAAHRAEVAALYDLSGQQSALGTPAARGAEIAFEDSRAARDAKLVMLDTRSSPEESGAVAARAARTAAVGMGATDSDIVLPAAKAFTDASRVFFVTGATDPTLPARAGRGAYMVAFGDDAQAVAAADFIAKRFGKRTLVVADEKYDYTRVLAEFFTKAYARNGGTVVDRIDPRAQGFAREFAANAGESRPDAVFLALEPDLIPTVLAAVRKALPETPLVGGDGFDYPGIERTDASSAQTAGAGGGGLYFTTHAWLGEGATPEAARFAERYRAKFGEEPTAFAALGYDAAMLARRAAALIAAHAHDRPRDEADARAEPDTAQAAGTEQDAQTSPDLAKVEASLRSQTPPYEGITGTISYASGPVPEKDVWIVETRAGRKTLAERARPERGKAR